jgi:hypothetical protein
VNRWGTAGNGGVGGEIGGIWEKPAGRSPSHWQGAPGVGSALLRGAGAPDRILPRIGASTGAPAHFWGRQCGPLFGPKPKFHARRVLGGILGPPVEMPGGDALRASPPHRRSQNCGRQVRFGSAGRTSQETGAGLPHRRPQNAGPKNCSFINLILIEIHICL